MPGGETLDPDEHVVKIVKRHIIGIVFIYIEALAGITALLALVFVLAPDAFKDLSGNSFNLFVGIVFFAVALLALVLFVATYVYRQSELLVTDKNLVQVLQRSLFNRKVSRLSMSNVEDVTADQRGILATIFNYGTLMIQTAGEMDNFVFIYCPNPNKYAEIVLDARQAYARSIQEEK